MKKIIMVIGTAICMLSATAQTISLSFNGANQNQNYQVTIDGTSYYSNSTMDANTSNRNGQRNINIPGLLPGSHTLAVYRLRNNSGVYKNGSGAASGNAVYTNTIQLRQGYDMNIKVNGNGGVSITEKRIKSGNNQLSVTPVSAAAFNEILSNVRSRFSQAQKLNAIRDAFSATGNYFTSAQVRELLISLSAEQNRLAMAKLGYSKLSDPVNFAQFFDVLRTNAARQEMNAYVRANPNYNNSSANSGTGNPAPVNNGPMADYQFNQLLQTMGSQANDALRMNIARESFYNSANWFTTSQIRQMLFTVYGEYDRVAMAKLAYARVYDKANFTSLYELISSAAGRTELNNFVIQNGGTGTAVNNTRVAMDESNFTRLYQQASGHLLPWNRTKDVTEFFNNSSYYFSVAQINQLLSVVSGEADKLTLAKLAWSRVTDPGNFSQTINLFTSQADRDALNAYIQARPY